MFPPHPENGSYNRVGRKLGERARDEAYQEAERRIEAARQEGATELDLSGLELTELPEAIASLAQLQSLGISKKQLREFRCSRPIAIA